MEPWQAEALYQHKREQRPVPRCVCCAEPIREERSLALEIFGLSGYSCPRCLDSAMVWTADIEE